MSSPVQSTRAFPKPKEATVLVADDEPQIRRVLSFLLGRLGYDVLVVENGKDAVETFKKHSKQIGTVILDVQMPKLDGVSAMTLIRQVEPEIAVILTSGVPRYEVIRKWAPEPPWVFLEKPFRLQDLGVVLPEIAAA